LANLAGPPSAVSAASKPKLVVLLVVDQMRADYVDLYGKNWKGGLARMFQKGAYFTNAAYPYLQTITCAGHATLSTGAYPYAHGLIQNAWFDRDSGKNVACTDDPTQPLVSYGTPVVGGDSPIRLMVPTLADQMRSQLKPASRVVSFSLKARSAIMIAGHAADAVSWTDGGSLVTSKAFAEAPVEALAQHIKAFPIDWEKIPSWTPMLPAAAYSFVDDGVAEATPKGWTRTFPHVLQAANTLETMANWTRSPFADDYLADMALQTTKTMKLGQTASTDYLAISFSVLDFVGHAFGPRSHEIQDVLARLDQSLGRFFDGLDKVVGKDKYVVALSADHGVAELPEQTAPLGLPGGRIPFTQLRQTLEAAVTRELGGQQNVRAMVYSDLYLVPGAYQKLLAKPGALDRVVAALKTVPGVADAFHDVQLNKPSALPKGTQRATALSFYRGRSGDIVFVPKAGWMLADAGTTHGSTNGYDQRVPLVFMGAGIKAAKYTRNVSPADLAPTLGQLIGVRLPKADGHALPEVARRR